MTQPSEDLINACEAAYAAGLHLAQLPDGALPTLTQRALHARSEAYRVAYWAGLAEGDSHLRTAEPVYRATIRTAMRMIDEAREHLAATETVLHAVIEEPPALRVAPDAQE